MSASERSVAGGFGIDLRLARRGFRRWARQIRPTDDALIFSARERLGVLQCVVFSGMSCVVLRTTSRTISGDKRRFVPERGASYLPRTAR